MSKKTHSHTEWWPFAGLLTGSGIGVFISPQYGWGVGGLLGLVCGYIAAGLYRSKKH